jgi:predicted secreted protein
MENIFLKIGETANLALPGLGSAGYRWQYVVEDAETVSVEKASGSEPSEMRQGSLEERFALTGLRQGKTIVHFTQARSFEPGKAPHAVRDVGVEVR